MKNEIKNRFTYHPPKEGQPERYVELRRNAHAFAELIVDLTPESREQNLALTHIEQVVMWANAAIARRE
ncbi:MAG: hypothetical protein P1S46_06240 [bacterium]|nr:hypothetical protein [bacterium]